VIGSVLYLKCDAAALHVDPLSRAGHYANRWVSLTPKDTRFQTIKALVLKGTFWANPAEAPSDSLPQRPSSISPLSTIL
jgi:hypothetical protein